jgi:CheY-like chemotaxis protein
MPVAVLIVDDEADTRQALTCCLEDEGYRVDEASDGQEALAVLRVSVEPLVVLLDYMMPRLDGRGVLTAVAQDAGLAGRHALILCTATDRRTLPLALVRLLSDLDVPVVPKPFDLDAPLAAVAAAGTRVAVPAGSRSLPGDPS